MVYEHPGQYMKEGARIMTVFQVSSKIHSSAMILPRRRRRRLPPQWNTAMSVVFRAIITTLIFGLPIFVWPFNRSNREARKALAAFTGSLREVIDLQRICEDSLAAVQQMVQPAMVTLWIRLNACQQ